MHKAKLFRSLDAGDAVLTIESHMLTDVLTQAGHDWEFGNALYAVTAGFAAPSPDFVVRVTK